MDDWIGSGFLSLGLSLVAQTLSLPLLFSDADALFVKIKAAKKAVKFTLDHAPGTLGPYKEPAQIIIAISEGDVVLVEAVLRSHPEVVNVVYPQENGITPLIAAIAFGQTQLVERVLGMDADPDLPDELVHYLPLMWAIHFNQLEMVKLLFSYQADPKLVPEGQAQLAIDLVKLDKPEIYEYFHSHGILKTEALADYYREPHVDDLAGQLASTTIISNVSEEEDEEDDDNDPDSEDNLRVDHTLVQLKSFDYTTLARDQYLKFTDLDIPLILDYMFNLRTTHPRYQHEAKYPAAILFQALRYAHQGVELATLTEFLFDCFIARLLAVTGTTSGVYNMATFLELGGSDIVLTSYWLAVVQFLHFYLTKAEYYNTYPKFLQELITMTRLLIVVLSFSINLKLDPLVDPCILDFELLVDVREVLYARDWNFYKQKKKHPNSFDDIVLMLYPPALTELMKPLPLKYLQVVLALDYVLRIHNVDDIFRSLAFSQVFYYSNAIIFNRIMLTSRYCTRTKAVQIRLNISAIEDWLRTHLGKAKSTERIGGVESLVAGTPMRLHSLLARDPHDKPGNDPKFLDFYYNSLYKVGKIQFNPVFELLLWLQVMLSFTDVELVTSTLDQFDDLNYYQVYKVMNKLYKYEVDEPKVAKSLREKVKQLQQAYGTAQVQQSLMHYMTQTTFLSKEEYIYLNPNWIFDVSLPNLNELVAKYGVGIGGIRVLRGKKYQPLLPMELMDEVDDIIQENALLRVFNRGETVEDDDEQEEENNEDDEEQDDEEREENGDDDGETFHGHKLPHRKENFHGDEIFKKVEMPDSLIHRNWTLNVVSEFEENPW